MEEDSMIRLQTIANDRYELSEKYRSDFISEEYFSFDRKVKKQVLVKVLHPDAAHRSVESLYRYRKVMDALKIMGGGLIVKVWDWGQWQDQDYVVLEGPERGMESLSRCNPNVRMPVDRVVAVVQRIACGLDRAHQGGCLHLSLSPESVLVHWVDGKPEVRIRDFGNYLLLDLMRVPQGPAVRQVFGYLAPEQTGILRKPVDARSDVYSLGILFYELLAGRLPYDSEDVDALVYRHIAEEPVAIARLRPDVPEILDRMVSHMIAKDPADRYQSLMGLVADLETFSELRRQGKEDPDFEPGRVERLSQPVFSTKLVGRRRELSLLRDRLQRVRLGEGALCCIESDPGAGKSRLSDELREDVHAMRGFFLAGKCEPYASQATGTIFAEAVETYIEQTKRLSEAERAAAAARIQTALGERVSEIAKVCPSIEKLLGPAPALERLDPEKERLRFLSTLSEFLLLLGTPARPVVLHLDDLQWADEVTIEVIERVALRLSRASLLLVASFRGNEAPAEHPLRLLLDRVKREKRVRLTHLRLDPLNEAEVLELVRQVLRGRVDDAPALASHLKKRSDGNPFCVLETLRSLTAEGLVCAFEGRYTFDPQALEKAVLPDRVVDMILRRVQNLPEKSIAALSCAAVIGKIVHPVLLAECLRVSVDDVLSVLEEAVNRQLLVRGTGEGGRLQFPHDRVREAFFGRLSPGERVPFHRRAAEVLEAQNQGRLERVVYDLAYHYANGGVRDQALLYSVKAAYAAKSTFANKKAAAFFETALGLMESAGLGPTQQYIDCLEDLGETYWLWGQYEKAVATLERCERLIGDGDVLRRARVISKKADALHEKGDTRACVDVIMRALRLLRVPMPRNPWLVKLGILREFGAQLLHMLLPRLFIKPEECTNSRDLAVVRMLARLSYILYFIDIDRTFYAYLKAVNFAERRGACKELVEFYMGGGVVWSTLPWIQAARRSMELGLKGARRIGSRVQEAGYHAFYCVIHEVENTPREGLPHAARAVELVRQLGGWFYCGLAVSTGTHLRVLTGEFQKADRECEEWLEFSRTMQMKVVHAWLLHDKLHLAAFSGKDWDELLQRREEYFAAFRDTQQYLCISTGLVNYALMESTRGDHEQAIADVEKAFELIPRHDISTWSLWSYPMAAQVYLNALRAPGRPRDKLKGYRRRALWFCRKSRQLGEKFRYIAGWSFQVQGTWHWLEGRHRKALRIWQQGLRHLENHTCDIYRIAHLKCEAALLMLERDGGDRRAYEYLLDARELFTKCDAHLFSDRVDQLLNRFKRREADAHSRVELTRKRCLDSLLSASQAIGSILVLEELLERMVQYSLRVTGGERGLLLLRRESGNELALSVARGVESGVLAQPFSYEEYRVSLALVEQAQQEQTPVIANAGDHTAAGKELCFQGVRQALCVPLILRQADWGVLYLDTRMSADVFGEAELELMKAFGLQAAVSIENAHLVKELVEQDRLKQEMKLGREIQRRLLPPAAPDMEGLDVHGFMQPAQEMRGDYYDFLERETEKGRRLAIVVGGVNSKGLAAGLSMAMVKAAVMTFAQERFEPRELVCKASGILQANLSREAFVSLVYLEWDPAARLMQYCRVGHEHIVVFREKTKTVELVPSGNVAVGSLSDLEPHAADGAFALEPGDGLLLYSNGAIEAINSAQEKYGLERLAAAVCRHGALSSKPLVDAVRGELFDFMGGRAPTDDITLVAIRHVVR